MLEVDLVERDSPVELKLPHARTEFTEKITFFGIPHEMTKTEKLHTKFRNTCGCMLGKDNCEESSLGCNGSKLHVFGDKWMRTPVKVSKYVFGDKE